MIYPSSVLMVLSVSYMLLVIDGKTISSTSLEDSFEGSSISPELEHALKPAEDAILSFIHKLVNTGYTSSKIALNKIEQGKHKDIGNQIQDLLELLPNYNSKISVVDDVPKVFKHSNLPNSF
ncbi:uncharacterized protein LOC115876098 [Sitophilus oryzae]|uniref:Uncharacterized protein LOC115876098 n=1 Tax=Sitophilus oryzae TaxID=7048 RepID=A0A6J2X9Z0_SITOR|nr:uncharacterized protein LOC115876098 [Sitophilus oryzae]